MSKRYVLEGTWSGYRSSQQRAVHRAVISENQAKRYGEIREIIYTDNTALWVSVRPCTYREKVKEIRGYDELLSEAYYSGKSGILRVPIEREEAPCA